MKIKSWVTIDHISSEIAQFENIWAICCDSNGNDVSGDHGALKNMHYDKWSRMAPKKMTVAQWKRQRFRKAFPGVSVRVFMSDGQEALDHASLDVVRISFANGSKAPESPNVQPLHFTFECPESDVAYRLKEELHELDYTVEVKIQKGWFSKTYQVVGNLPQARVFPWELLEWRKVMRNRAEKYSSQITAWPA